MENRPSGHHPGADADNPATAAAATRPSQRLIIVMLVAAAALDLTRCGLRRRRKL